MGKAALHAPALAVLSHTPPGATETIAWVGKGIVYDTGGLSLKGKVRIVMRGKWQHYKPYMCILKQVTYLFPYALLFSSRHQYTCNLDTGIPISGVVKLEYHYFY